MLGRGLHPVRAASLALLALAVAFGAASILLGLWPDGMPGPGLLSLFASLILGCLAAGLAWSNPYGGTEEPFQLRPLAALALFSACAAAYPWFGFVLPSFVLLAVWIRSFHERPLASALVLSATLVAACVLAFRFVLSVPMPLWPGT